MSTGEILTLPIDTISISGGTQSRVSLNQDAVAEYAEVIRLAGELPPVVVFNDGDNDGLWLADGFHRFHAHRAAGALEIVCDVRVGTQRDAILFSVGANAAHGLRRTNDDKRKAVKTLLDDAEWATWSDREIARQCGVSAPFVASVRSPAATIRQQENRENSAANCAGVKSDYTPAPDQLLSLTNATGLARADEAEPAQVVTVTTSPPPVKPGKLESDSTLGDVKLPKDFPATPLVQLHPTPSEVDHIADANRCVQGDELDALREQIADLSESLKSTLADNEMMGRVFDADEQIKAAMAEVARWRAIAENAERTLDGKNGEYVARAKMITHWKGRAEKAEKALAKMKEKYEPAQ